MPIRINDRRTELLARKLANLADVAQAEAIETAVEERYARLGQARAQRSIGSDLTEIAMRCAGRPIISDLTDYEILGYDSAYRQDAV